MRARSCTRSSWRTASACSCSSCAAAGSCCTRGPGARRRRSSRWSSCLISPTWWPWTRSSAPSPTGTSSATAPPRPASSAPTPSSYGGASTSAPSRGCSAWPSPAPASTCWRAGTRSTWTCRATCSSRRITRSEAGRITSLVTPIYRPVPRTSGQVRAMLAALEELPDPADEPVGDDVVTLEPRIDAQGEAIQRDHRLLPSRIRRQRLVIGGRQRAKAVLVPVVVARDRLAAHLRRALQRLRVAVEGDARGAEQHAAVEGRLDLLMALPGLHVPEFQEAVVFLLPILVEEDEEVQLAAPVLVHRVS